MLKSRFSNLFIHVFLFKMCENLLTHLKASTFIEHRLSYAVVTVYSVIAVILLCGEEFSERDQRIEKKEYINHG